MDTYIILDCILVIISIIMLWKGADWLVDSASEIAHTLKVSDLIIGLTGGIASGKSTVCKFF